METPAQYDVIIVGAGPAGTAAAKVLATAGRSVLVVDKAFFPREKLCAGILTWKTMRALQRIFGADASSLMQAGIINHKSSRYRIRHRQSILSQAGMAYPFHFVSRLDFDAWCLAQALDAGGHATFGAEVVWADAGTARVRTRDGREFRGQWLIGADGASSRVRACCGLETTGFRAGQGMGLEMHIPRAWLAGRAGLHEDLLADFPTVYAGFVDTGYAWSFPHRDRVIIGVCGLYHARPQGMLKRCLEDFLAFLGLPKDHGLPVRAHPLPYGNWLAHPGTGRTLLAGDAAALVEPLFGEGIFYALRTGEMAARAVLAGFGNSTSPQALYQADLERGIFPELIWAKRLRNLLYRLVRLKLALPVRLFLGVGGARLQELVHGMRSFKFMRRL